MHLSFSRTGLTKLFAGSETWIADTFSNACNPVSLSWWAICRNFHTKEMCRRWFIAVFSFLQEFPFEPVSQWLTPSYSFGCQITQDWWIWSFTTNSCRSKNLVDTCGNPYILQRWVGHNQRLWRWSRFLHPQTRRFRAVGEICPRVWFILDKIAWIMFQPRKTLVISEPGWSGVTVSSTPRTVPGKPRFAQVVLYTHRSVKSWVSCEFLG